MARIKWFSYILNEEGQPIGGANISIYLAGTTQPARIYTSEVGGEYIDTVPQLKTNDDGYFEFWIADEREEGGYSSAQKFKIAWQRTGIASGYNDYINIFPVILPVDIGDLDKTKDKAVSNYLASLWEDHRTDDTHTVHGILEVNENQTGVVKNKLVSNKLAKGWEDHKNAPYSSQPHNIELVDETDSNSVRNRLVSNYLAKGWEDHKDLNYNETPHNIELADETSSNTTKNKLVSNEQLKTLYDFLDNFSFSASASSVSLTASGDEYYTDISHNLQDKYPFVNVYNTDIDEKIVPSKVYSVDQNTLRLFFADQINVAVKIITTYL